MPQHTCDDPSQAEQLGQERSLRLLSALFAEENVTTPSADQMFDLVIGNVDCPACLIGVIGFLTAAYVGLAEVTDSRDEQQQIVDDRLKELIRPGGDAG